MDKTQLCVSEADILLGKMFKNKETGAVCSWINAVGEELLFLSLISMTQGVFEVNFLMV